jgi:hypothetical protein
MRPERNPTFHGLSTIRVTGARIRIINIECWWVLSELDAVCKDVNRSRVLLEYTHATAPTILNYTNQDHGIHDANDEEE